MAELKKQNWDLEVHLNIATADRPGKLDAVLSGSSGRVAIEWETGNISSSHRIAIGCACAPRFPASPVALDNETPLGKEGLWHVVGVAFLAIGNF
jgi:hypothetical protein